MKLLLRRDQRTGVLGKITFTLDVRAEISDDERQNIKKYKLGDSVLYANYTMIDRGSGLLGLLSRLWVRASKLSISVNDLANGKRVACKDIVEMVAIEEYIREAGKLFVQILAAAAHFGGDEVIEL